MRPRGIPNFLRRHAILVPVVVRVDFVVGHGVPREDMLFWVGAQTNDPDLQLLRRLARRDRFGAVVSVTWSRQPCRAQAAKKDARSFTRTVQRA